MDPGDISSAEGIMLLTGGFHRDSAGDPWALVAQKGENRQVFLWTRHRPYPSVQHLQHLFRLTPAQARVAQMLVSRRTNAEISDLLGVTIHTARRHVEAVLLRLDARSRWDVEQLVYMAAATLAPRPPIGDGYER